MLLDKERYVGHASVAVWEMEMWLRAFLFLV